MLYKKLLFNIFGKAFFASFIKIIAIVFTGVFLVTIVSSLNVSLFFTTEDFSKEPQSNYNKKIFFLRPVSDDEEDTEDDDNADNARDKANLAEVTYFITEFATSYEETTRGMMFRESLPENYGMLFIFKSEEPRQFWMQNTSIPLDIIFIGKDMQIKHIHHNAKPYDMAVINSVYPAQYVLEINAGEAKHLQIGDILHKPPHN